MIGFYSYFSTTPKGKHTIRVCLGTACYVKGSKRILNKLKEILGIEMNETTADGLFTIEVKYCLGCCGLAPVMLIDDTVHQRVKPSKINEILSYYKEKVSEKK